MWWCIDCDDNRIVYSDAVSRRSDSYSVVRGSYAAEAATGSRSSHSRSDASDGLGNATRVQPLNDMRTTLSARQSPDQVLSAAMASCKALEGRQ